MIAKRRRSSLEIIANILEVASKPEGVGKTHIMYKSNLSNKLVQEYLNFVVEKKLIDVTMRSKRRFKISERGREYLKKFRGLETILAV